MAVAPAEVLAHEWALDSPVKFVVTDFLASDSLESFSTHHNELTDKGIAAVRAMRVDKDGKPDESTAIVLIFDGCGAPVFLDPKRFPQFPAACATWELPKVHVASVSAGCKGGIMQRLFGPPDAWPPACVIAKTRPSLIETSLEGNLKRDFEVFELAYSVFGTVMLVDFVGSAGSVPGAVREMISDRGPAGFFNHTDSCMEFPRADPSLFGATARRAFEIGDDDEMHAAVCMARKMTDSKFLSLGGKFSESEFITDAQVGRCIWLQPFSRRV